MSNFTGQIDKWVLQTKQRQEAVFRQSSQRVIETMQKSVPVDTGFLKSSMMVQLNTPLPAANRTGTGGAEKSYQMTLASATIGDYITAGYTAVYALRLEFGFVGKDALGRSYSQPPRAWVRTAAAQWPRIVSQVVGELKGRAR